MANPTYSGPRITVVVSEELKRQIGHISVDEGKDKPQVVRELIQEALKARGREVPA